MIKNETVGQDKKSRKFSPFPAVALVLTVLLAAGCAGQRKSRFHANPLEESFTLPPFLTGPVALALTNVNDFSARVVVDLSSYSAKSKTITGNMLVQGSHLLFAPAVGDRTFVWDEAQNKGYILSEALQGYAPIASSIQITNVVQRGRNSAPDLVSVNGRPCQQIEMIISSDDGSTVKLTLWREANANGFPARISVLDGPNPLTIDFSDCRRESLAQKLFLPPDGFTRYATAQTLRDEIQLRQQAVNKKSRSDDNGVSEIGHADGPSQISR